MPYCLQKQKNGKYVVLNRKYKPVGFCTNEHLNFEKYPICFKMRGINSKTAASLSVTGDDNTNNIYLYSDKTIPTKNKENMRRYFDRLQKLLKYKLIRK